MEEAWKRAVEAALEGKVTSSSEVRVLNLDGAVKSLHGCLPPAVLLERFPNLEHLSIANVGAPSLGRFPRLRKLQKLILSDNRIAGGLESLVEAGLHSLKDLDLSNNRIQYIEVLAPLAELSLVSLDMYECPVTRIDDYRMKVFSMIRTLRYLDKLDANGNERPETDDEEEDEDEDDEYDEDEEDPGSGEIDGADQAGKLTGAAVDYCEGDDGIVDADEDDESDADEEETETGGRGSAHESYRASNNHHSNGFRVASLGVEGDDVEDADDEYDDDLGEEIDEEADDEDEEVDMHHSSDSDGDDDDDDDGVDVVEPDEEEIDEDCKDDDNDDDELDENEEDLGDGDDEAAEPGSTGRLANTEGEIDGHEHGEEDENGVIGEEDEQGAAVVGHEEEVYGDGEDEDDLGGEYLVQPIARSNRHDSSAGNEEDEVDQNDGNRQINVSLQRASSSSSSHKRVRDEGPLDDDDGGDVDDKTKEIRLARPHE